ncbi:MAG TPA: M13 family peptidase, partial [Allosphingosinicella sp.]
MRNHRLALCAFMLLAGTAPVHAQSQPRAADARPPQAAPGSAAARQGQPRYGTFGIDLAARDLTVDAGDDFYRYANGTWLNSTEIPADRTGWSLWTVLSEDIEQQLRAIVTDASTSADPAQRRVGDFYAAWMDEAGIEARGTAPLHPYLQRIGAIRNRDDLLAT